MTTLHNNPTVATQPAAYPQDWMRVSEASHYARVSKPTLYAWMDAGLIKSFSNRQRGQIKGTRLISFDSLKAFLESRCAGGTQP